MSQVVKGICDRCEQFKSRRDAMVVEVYGIEKFICAECADFFAGYFNLTKSERAETYKWFMEGAR